MTNSIYEKKDRVSLKDILNYHPKAFSIGGRRAHSCYFLEENSESMILLSRLYQRFDRDIEAYGTTRPIVGDDIPRLYFDYVGTLTNNTGMLSGGVLQIKGFAEEWNRMRNLEKKVELKL